MSAWVAALNEWGVLFGAAAGRACFQGGMAILLVWLVCRTCPTLSGFTQSWLWRLAHLKLIAALVIPGPLPLPLLPAPVAVVVVEAPAVTLNAQRSAASPQFQPPSEGSIPPHRSPAPPAALGWPGALLLAWLAGLAVVLVRIMREGLRAGRELRSAAPVTDEKLLTTLDVLCIRFRLRWAPPVRTADTLGGPILMAAPRPVIVLPQAVLASNASAELRLMLAHEVAHLKRRDLAWGWLPVLCHALFYFFPPVWLAYREYRLAHEVACDELTLHVLAVSPADYGAMLLKVAHPAANHPRLAAVGVAESYETLSRRLKAMKQVCPRSRRSFTRAAAVLLGLAAVGLVPWRVVAQDRLAGELLLTLKGPQEMVFAIAYSPDGKTIASGGQDKNVILWDAGTGKMKATLPGHMYDVDSMAFSPDGKTLATAGRVNIVEPGFVGSGGEIRLWDVGSGQLVRSIKGHRSSILSVAWSPDGRTLATSGGYDKTVRLWDVATGAGKRVFDQFGGVIHDVRFSPDGRTLATGGSYDDRTVKLWDVSTGELKFTFTGHHYGGWRLAFSPDGKTIFSTGGSTRKGENVTGNELILWDPVSGEVRRVIEQRGRDWARSVAYSPAGDQVAIATGNDAEGQDKAGYVKVYEVRTGKLIHTLRGHTDAAYSLAYSPDGKRLACGSLDGTVKVWQVR